MDYLLARGVIGPVVPNRGVDDRIPEPYRTTVKKQRALKKAEKDKAKKEMKGSQPVEPGEVG